MKRLLLLGGGHAHVKVLADLAQRPLAGWDVHLVTPYRRQIYSGMLPGWIAGHYPLEACALPLDELAARAAVTFHQTAGSALDLQHNALHCADGSALHFDLLSINTGPVAALDRLPGSLEHALPIRPIEAFVAAWPALVDRIHSHCRRFDPGVCAAEGVEVKRVGKEPDLRPLLRTVAEAKATAGKTAATWDFPPRVAADALLPHRRLAIVGAGAAGVELAFAIHRRAQIDGWSHMRIVLVDSDALPLNGAPARLRLRVAMLLAQRGVSWLGQRHVVRIETGQLVFAQGEPLAFDDCLVVTGAAAPSWPRESGLATDARGFIRVGPSLQSASHPQVLAVGDVAAYHEERPKSGVYAVKAGPILADNLRALCEGRAPRSWTPQRSALYLIATGDQQALASWGQWSWSGRWVWRWKDWIDRRFMRRFGAAL